MQHHRFQTRISRRVRVGASAAWAIALLVGAVSPALAQTTSVPWYERVRFGGDFRSRYEGFYQDGSETRNRFRMRLRLRVDTDINEDTRLHLRVASGDPGTPVSTNQTFTEFFLPKPFNLDRAYLLYNPTAAPALTLGLGKFNARQKTTQMTFDEDLNYEGGWEQVAWKPREGIGMTLGALQTAVNERSAAVDSYMVGGHGGVTFAVGRHNLQFSAANYVWGNPDRIAIGSVRGPLESILTNSLVRDGNGAVVGFASRFNVVDVIAEATFRTSRANYPVRLLADFARNTKADNDRDSGLWVEAEYGAPRATGTWGTGYTYGSVEQDVSPSAFVFSDMPGTNVRLHMIEASYILKTGFSLDATLHVTKRLFLEAPTQPNPWRSRLHLAAVVRF